MIIGSVAVFVIVSNNVVKTGADGASLEIMPTISGEVNDGGDDIPLILTSQNPDWEDVGRCWENGVEIDCENLDTLEQDYNDCEELEDLKADECILELASGGFFKLCKEIKDPDLYNLCYVRAFEQGGGLL